jgi:hypothetical protein
VRTFIGKDRFVPVESVIRAKENAARNGAFGSAHRNRKELISRADRLF